jgi:hypothetical protein
MSDFIRKDLQEKLQMLAEYHQRTATLGRATEEANQEGKGEITAHNSREILHRDYYADPLKRRREK